MHAENLYQELVKEYKLKLGRNLTLKELEFLKWMKDRHLELYFNKVKSS